MITEIDQICALQAGMVDLYVVSLEYVVNEVDIFTSATGNFNTITLMLRSAMKINDIVGNSSHFVNVINDRAKVLPWHKRGNIKPQVDHSVFPDEHGVIILAASRLLKLGCVTGHPSFERSCSFTNQVLPQLDFL